MPRVVRMPRSFLRSMEGALFRKILYGGYTDLYQREDGSWGLVIDMHEDLTSVEAQVIQAIWDEEDEDA